MTGPAALTSKLWTDSEYMATKVSAARTLSLKQQNSGGQKELTEFLGDYELLQRIGTT